MGGNSSRTLICCENKTDAYCRFVEMYMSNKMDHVWGCVHIFLEVFWSCCLWCPYFEVSVSASSVKKLRYTIFCLVITIRLPQIDVSCQSVDRICPLINRFLLDIDKMTYVPQVWWLPAHPAAWTKKCLETRFCIWYDPKLLVSLRESSVYALKNFQQQLSYICRCY
jgi:hypothetical protein